MEIIDNQALSYRPKKSLKEKQKSGSIKSKTFEKSETTIIDKIFKAAKNYKVKKLMPREKKMKKN